MRPREVVKLIRAHGWRYLYTNGGHAHFEHPTLLGKVTVPQHPGDINPNIVKLILRQAGIKKEDV